ncbi:MAG: hypothetical protein QXK89_03015 [Candidatus Bathyarchaeia archaeon]
MHIYEYLFAAFVVISILLAATFMLTITSEPLRVSSERENLKSIAHTILTRILLDPGDPIDWGSNTSISVSDLKSFGLAYQRYEVSPKDAYVLDPDKISRLNKNNPFYISPIEVRKLLGLSDEYGFTIELLPALNIEVNQTEVNKYKISVKSIYNVRPLSDANVTARIYYIMGNGLIGDHLIGPYTTGPDGATEEIDVSEFGNNYVIIFVVEYYDIIVPKLIGHNVNWSYLTGDILRLYASPISSEEVITSPKNGGYEVESLTVSLQYLNPHPNGGNLYNVSFVEPGFIAVLASAGGDLVVATKMLDHPYGTSSSITGSYPLGYVMEENVLIDGFSYVIRLYVWRLVW